ncbi:cell envelope integrity protein CreD [Tenacibaculum sp. Bg11-29]|uniref:cell envelope integrity protein CreD n=1 Tax=Tenacibaculum sp. Bg11-29 TaxID=2058306 RepID=UPI000C34A850|nr:cell envelope integrity protein CreD [Tenacibaculum sp. Bg11-29]PKH52809.1 cell envelope integrity protein CreD [Tenacibaculum sp. Bg11-29]
METLNKQNGRFGKWVKTSITARMLMVGFLILILLIPLSFIKSLIYERMNRQQEVVKEINKKWGKEVLLYGPILKIPYKTYHKKSIVNQKTKEVQTEMVEEINYGYFFPKKLDVNSTINPEEKKRGIYKTAVYNSNINISGSFTQPDFSEMDISKEDILWNKARLIIETSNLKGVNSLVEIKLNKNTYSFTSKYKNNNSNNTYNNGYLDLHKLESKFINKDDIPTKNDVAFSLNININGSKQIRFIPVGKETNINIKSDWKTANFIGEYLPYNSDKISKTGFDASWKILDINRPFPQQSFKGIPNLKDYAFGVNFMIPVDEYQKSERSTKYGFLVIGLTFLIFFLIQTMSKISIHPFQYLMIGVALTMFYTLLISISEHSSFLKAYIVSGIAVIGLISLYSKSILKGMKFPIFIALSLIALYAFIFIIIQLENYALLVGSVGLFVILASVMYASRKIDWQNG